MNVNLDSEENEDYHIDPSLDALLQSVSPAPSNNKRKRTQDNNISLPPKKKRGRPFKSSTRQYTPTSYNPSTSNLTTPAPDSSDLTSFDAYLVQPVFDDSVSPVPSTSQLPSPSDSEDSVADPAKGKQKKGSHAKLTPAQKERFENYVYDAETGSRFSDAEIIVSQHFSAAQLRILQDVYNVKYATGALTDKEDIALSGFLTAYKVEHELENDQALSAHIYSKPLPIDEFWAPLAEHVTNRPIHPLYLHLKSTLAKRRAAEDWTNEQDEQLIALVAKHGRKWAKISRLMDDIAPADLANRFASHGHTADKTRAKSKVIFDDEELLLLAKAVHAVERKYRSVAVKGFWEFVAKQVPGRTPLQLKQKWISMNRITANSQV